MGRPNFDDTLLLPDPRTLRPGEKPTPRARGPLADDQRLMWVYVWLVQNGDDWSAAADGESPEESPNREKWQRKTEEEKVWEIELEMTDGSDDFHPERPALATAMALVQYEDGRKEVDWWSEAVALAVHQSRASAAAPAQETAT